MPGVKRESKGMKYHAAFTPAAVSTANTIQVRRHASYRNTAEGTAMLIPMLVPAFMMDITRPCIVRLTNAVIASVSFGIIKPAQIPQINPPIPIDSAHTTD